MTVNRVDRRDKILHGAVSLPNVVCAPAIRRGEIAVDFRQLPIKGVAELPEGVVDVHDGRLVQNRFMLLFICLIVGGEELCGF